MKLILKSSLTLAAALLIWLPAARSQVTDENDIYLGFDAESGALDINGEPFQARGPAVNFLYSEVEKIQPAPGDGAILYLRPLELRQAGKQDSAVKVSGDAKPFAYDLEWKLFDSDGEPTDDPFEASHVLMRAPTEGDARSFSVVWKECEGNLTGNHVGYECTNRRFLSDDYAAYLRAHLFQCVGAGLARVGDLKRAGDTKAAKVHLLHNGTLGDDRHSTQSLHAAGRAVDIKTMTVTTTKGVVRKFVFETASKKPRSMERAFYFGFRRCWHTKMVKRRCPAKDDPGGIGTIGWEDERHQHHLHTSMPFCPNNRGYFITDAEYIRQGKAPGRVPASAKKKKKNK